jgi:hypothetical protein
MLFQRYKLNIFYTSFVYVEHWLPWWHNPAVENSPSKQFTLIRLTKNPTYFPRRFQQCIDKLRCKNVDSTGLCPVGGREPSEGADKGTPYTSSGLTKDWDDWADILYGRGF